MKNSKKRLFSVIAILIFLVTISTEKGFAQNVVDRKDLEKTTSYVANHYSKTFDIQKNTALFTKIDNENTGSTKYFSTNADSQFYWLSLRDSEFKRVTGIKASRMEIIQNNKVVARANTLESFSTLGEYRTHNLEMLNSFQNVNGKNFVDIVLYAGSKEVTRLKDFEFNVFEDPAVSFIDPYQIGVKSTKFGMSVEMLNVNQSQSVEVYLLDEQKNRITNTDKVVSDDYSQNEKIRQMDLGLSFIDPKFLREHAMYEVVIEVDGQIIHERKNQAVYLWENSYIGTTYIPEMPNLRYRGTGINLIGNGPYRIEIEQNNEITKELNNVQAFFNEETYNEEINVELLPEYFISYGAAYKIRVYNATNIEMINFDFLVKKDEIKENDVTNPFEGFKTFKKRDNIEPSKTWHVTFNKPVDQNSIHNGNMYIVNKQSGKSVKVDYALQEGGTVLDITPETNFTSGATYTLIVDQRVTSEASEQLSEPAVIEFTVK